MSRILLTGVTGLVGQFLLRDLLQAGARLAVLIRSRRMEPAKQRLQQILARWERELGRPLPRPVCLEGDITQPGLGLNGDARLWVKNNITSVLHNAASLTFVGEDPEQEPWLSNYFGTKHVLDLSADLHLREFHHVSTAYVCGKRADLVREDELDVGQHHRNDYERCKFQAEKLVHSANNFERVTVYRPAVIVGDTKTGYTVTYHGFYSYCQFISLAMQQLPRAADGWCHQPIRLNLTGEERRNLIPVDWVSAVMTHIVQRPELHGKTYQLTPEQGTRAKDLDQATSSFFKYDGQVFAGQAALHAKDMNVLEHMFYSYLEKYQPYWTEDPQFDSSNTQAAAPHLPCPTLDKACLHRLLQFAVADNWGQRKATLPAPTFAASAGALVS